MKKTEITPGIEYALLAPNAREFRGAEKVRFTESGLAEKPGYRDKGKVWAQVYRRNWISHQYAWESHWVMPSFVRQTWAEYLTQQEELEKRRAQARAQQLEDYKRLEEENELLRAFLAENKEQLASLGLPPMFGYRGVVELKLNRSHLQALLAKVGN
jgi:hypothetical protein